MVITNQDKQFVVAKGIIPKSLKIKFKVFCVHKKVEMSKVIEDLIKQWLQNGAPVPQLDSNLIKEELEEIKGYIPESLKYQFKAICKQNKTTMRFVLYVLITNWVEMESVTGAMRFCEVEPISSDCHHPLLSTKKYLLYNV